MSFVAQRFFSDLPGWQAILDRQIAVFADVVPGSRIGIVARRDTESKSLDAKLLAWEAQPGGMVVAHRPFQGYENAGVDLLFVADDEAIESIYENAEGDTISVMKEWIRRGRILFFVLKPKNELLEAGYEGFLDSLGLAFLGACR